MRVSDSRYLLFRVCLCVKHGGGSGVKAYCVDAGGNAPPNKVRNEKKSAGNDKMKQSLGANDGT